MIVWLSMSIFPVYGSQPPDLNAYIKFIAEYRTSPPKKLSPWAKKFHEVYPTSVVADNVFYLIGEKYYLKSDFSAAAKMWKQQLRLYPHGDKAVSALYGLAICHLKVGKKKRGLDLLKKLVKRYPKSQEAQQAKLTAKSY